tara:strand:+ start:2214 stop:2456 length:243 start_codon:yes stop_codon:yes gene_type:complete
MPHDDGFFECKLGTPVDTLLRNYVFDVVHLCEGNRTQAAKLINVGQRTIRLWILKWDKQGHGVPDYGSDAKNKRFIKKRD